MLKFAVLLALACIVWRWALGQWPWDGLRGGLGSSPSRRQALARARALLNVDDGASRDQILSAHKRLIARVHPDRGGNSAAVHEANDARDLLLAQNADHIGARHDGSVQDHADKDGP